MAAGHPAALLVLEVTARKAAVPEWLRWLASKKAGEPPVDPRLQALRSARRRVTRRQPPPVREDPIPAAGEEAVETPIPGRTERPPDSSEPAAAMTYTARLLEAKRRLDRGS